MTPVFLISSLAEKLREVVKTYKLLAENQPDKKVSIFEHDIPRAEFKENTFYPCVIVTLISVEDVEDAAIATVQFTICTYAGENYNDWRDMLNISERIRQFLRETYCLAEKYIREYPIAFEPVKMQDQPAPFIIGRIACRFQIGALQPHVPRRNILELHDDIKF